jgi:signal peptidase I
MKPENRIATVMGLVMPGMGQLYNSEPVKGASCFVIFLAVYAIGFRAAVLLPDSLLLPGVVCTLALSLATYILAVVDAGRGPSGERPELIRKRYARWYFFLAAWLLGSVLTTGAVYSHVRDGLIEAFKIPSASMEPAVLSGDRVLADKTAYNRMPPKRGDIVIFVYPDDRSKRFIKRIEALPGEKIGMPDGTAREVPHGFVYVTGDNREKSVDSREFGFVPLRDVTAKVRQIYYSSGPEGVRWNRIGMTL